MKFTEKAKSNFQIGSMASGLSVILGIVFAIMGFTTSFGGDAYTYIYKATALGFAALLTIVGLLGVFFFNGLSQIENDTEAKKEVSEELPTL